MTAAQIIILSLLGILDIYLTIVRPLMKFNDTTTPIWGFIRMLLLWAIALGGVYTSNQLYEKSKEPHSEKTCPEYEQVTEPIYRLKTSHP